MLILIEGPNKEKRKLVAREMNMRLGIPLCSSKMMRVEYLDTNTDEIEYVSEEVMKSDPAIVFERLNSMLNYIEAVGYAETILLDSSHLSAYCEGIANNFNSDRMFKILDKRFFRLGTIIVYIKDSGEEFVDECVLYNKMLGKSDCKIITIDTEKEVYEETMCKLKEVLELC